MSDTDNPDSEEEMDDRPRGKFEARSEWTHRAWGATKTFIIFGIGVWLVVALGLQISAGGMRWRQRNRIALLVAIPTGLLLAGRRFAIQYSRLVVDDNQIVLRNSFGAITVATDDVRGLVGAGGMALSVTESVVWRYVVILTSDKRYVLSFDSDLNQTCFEFLRQCCGHAWAIPYEGKLQPPMAGAELDPDEYINGLQQVHRYYWLHTVNTLFNGVLMLSGGSVALYALANGMLNVRRPSKLYFWFGAIAFLGIVLLVRAGKQWPVLTTIKRAEKRLREAA